MGYRIRPEGLDDSDAVAAVHVRAWQIGYAGLMPDEYLARLDPAPRAQLRRERLRADPPDPFVSLVAEDEDGSIVGFATVGPYRNQQDRNDLDHGHGELLAIYVDPPRWGSGAGQALMDAAVAELTARGFSGVRLWVLADNVRARRFYERAGLVPDGVHATFRLSRVAGMPDGAGVGTELVEIRYAARLPRPASG